ncbi:MAG: hypothetical protein AAB495_02750 [Patescibacteria group bacterium]
MKKIFYSLAIIFALSLSGRAVGAASTPRIYFVTSEKEFFAGEELRIAVFLDSPFPINALDLELGFSPRTLAFLGFYDGSSIIDVWKDSPVVFEEGIVRIRGGMLKGFSGDAGEVLQLRFRGAEEGKGQISLRSGKAYRSDGLGTEVVVPISFAEILIGPSSGARVTKSANTDETPPNVTLQTTKDPATERDLLVLSASDPESGIKESFVRFRKFLFWGPWQSARIPLRIPSGVWEIQSKTVNNDGLVRERVMYIPGPLLARLALLFIAIVVLAALSFIHYNKRRI